MRISRSAYYHKSLREERQYEKDMELKAKIEEIHVELPGYGYRRIHEQLLREGKAVNGKRIRRVMKQYCLYSCVQKFMKP